jgi:hypothetical protein
MDSRCDIKAAGSVLISRNRKWDQQIEADSASGALDFLIREVEAEIAQGKTRPTGFGLARTRNTNG